MGSYTVIADAGKSIVKLLQREMIPEPVNKPEDIGLCTPDEPGNAILGLYLYDIEENPEVRNGEKIILDREHFKNPPTSLNLYYMLFVKTNADAAVKSADEQIILGRAIQAFSDYSRLPQDALEGTLLENHENLDIQGIVVDVETKHRVYSRFNSKDFIAFFYKAGPVFIDSEKIRRVKRVTDATLTLDSKNNRGRGR